MPGTPSLLDSLLSLSAEDRAAALAGLADAEARALLYDWRGLWARPKQLAPSGAWRIWLVMAGRGYGKTRIGAEWVRAEVESGRAGRIALVGETAADARDVMVEGESGILAVSPPWNRPRYEPSKRRLTWPNGAIATTYSADDPEQLRGPQHDGAWADEIGKWRYADECWDNLEMGLRLGAAPRAVATTTPRPIRLVRELLRQSQDASGDVAVTAGSTYENSDNLAEAFFRRLRSRYEGTRLGRQELYAELLTDTPGALWSLAAFDADGFRARAAPALRRVVVAVDPAVTHGEDADETGIVVAGLGEDGVGYVLADVSCRESPDGWARRVVAAYRQYRADRVVAEVNQGGELVEHVLRTVDAGVPLTTVRAARGKAVRAEPVAALYEQGRVRHVGAFGDLESQLLSFVPGMGGRSPDRMDALVYALTELMLDGADSVQEHDPDDCGPSEGASLYGGRS